MTTVHITTPKTAAPAMSLADEQRLWTIAEVMQEAIISATGEAGPPVSREGVIRFAVRFAADVATMAYSTINYGALFRDSVASVAEEIAGDVVEEEADQRALRRMAARLYEALPHVLSHEDAATLDKACGAP